MINCVKDFIYNVRSDNKNKNLLLEEKKPVIVFHISKSRYYKTGDFELENSIYHSGDSQDCRNEITLYHRKKIKTSLEGYDTS